MKCDWCVLFRFTAKPHTRNAPINITVRWLTAVYSNHTGILQLRVCVNPFQLSDAMWHDTFNSIPHMLKLFGVGKG
jgi:hypothetical protein